MSYPFPTEASDELPAEFEAPFADDADEASESVVEEQAEDSDAEPDRKSAKRKHSTRSARLSSAQVRRVLAQADVVNGLDRQKRDLLAAALATNADVVDLVVGTLVATKSSTAAIERLTELTEETSPFQLTVSAIAIAGDRDLCRRVWALLAALGHVTGTIPAKDVLAGAKIAEAATGIDETDKAILREAAELLSA